MPQIDIRIENIEQIRAAFHSAPALAAEEFDKAVKQSVFTIEATSKLNTPVRTGYLRASHETTFRPLEGVITPTAAYAIYVHEGTYKMAGRPFLADAVRSNEQKVNDFFSKAMQNVFDKIARST